MIFKNLFLVIFFWCFPCFCSSAQSDLPLGPDTNSWVLSSCPVVLKRIPSLSKFKLWFYLPSSWLLSGPQTHKDVRRKVKIMQILICLETNKRCLFTYHKEWKCKVWHQCGRSFYWGKFCSLSSVSKFYKNHQHQPRCLSSGENKNNKGFIYLMTDVYLNLGSGQLYTQSFLDHTRTFKNKTFLF